MTNNENHIDNPEEILALSLELISGSVQAFQILHKKYSQRIYRFCLRILCDDASAKDAYQETFIKVYENRASFTGNNFTAWIYTIARNNCMNIIRKYKPTVQFNEYYHNTSDESSDGNYVDFGLRDFIQNSLKSLPLALREALILREYEDCSYQEIAAILEIDISLAKVRVFRARNQMKKMLEPIMKEFNEIR